MILLVALNQIEQLTERHQPHLLLREAEVRKPKVKQSGKQLVTVYPTIAFFGFSSLLTWRSVPFFSASKIASL